MSRFKGTYRPASPTTAATAVVAPVTPPPPPRATPELSVPRASQSPAPPRGLIHRLGFFFLAAYLLAGVINGAASRLTGNTTYITAVCLVLLPILFVLNGRLGESMKVGVGKLWIFFALWLILDVATSIWKTGSILVLSSYLPRSLMLYFFVISFAVSLAENRRLMAINIFVTFLLVLNCIAFGSMKSGRLEIPDSLFFENANDLGLALLLGLCQTVYLLYIPGVKNKLWVGLVAIGSLYFLLKTASRGCFGALLLTALVAFFISRQKFLVGVAGAVALTIVMVAMPGGLLRRLTFIVSDASSLTITSDAEMASYGSQLQREQLLRQSVELTAQHPLFGVGPGDFAVAVYEDAKRENKHTPWLGTHNSYTEISSECGLPALFAYLAIIFWTLKTSWKIHRSSVGRPGMHAVAGLSASLLLGTIAFASGTFFFHVAYSGFLPILSGSAAALRNAVDRGASPSLALAA